MLTDTDDDPLAVEATQSGFYGSYKTSGDRFLLRHGKSDFSRRWMLPLRGNELAEFFGVSREHLSVDFLWTQVLADREILALVGFFELQPVTQGTH